MFLKFVLRIVRYGHNLVAHKEESVIRCQSKASCGHIVLVRPPVCSAGSYVTIRVPSIMLSVSLHQFGHICCL